MTTLIAFDNDGVLRDESVSYLRCVAETVEYFGGRPATETELVDSLKKSNDDWERTYNILRDRGMDVGFDTVKNHFQDLYLGKSRDFSGYINDEPWLADNRQLRALAEKYPLVIVSGAPLEEVRYTLKRNGATDYFSKVWGMFECDGKNDGLRKAITEFGADKVYFCDDRPSPIKAVFGLSPEHDVEVYGIVPPGAPDKWAGTLADAGARRVFRDVKEYCGFLQTELP